MIEYKNSGNESLIERVSSANLDGTISLTGLWEIIIRTKRLPDDLDLKVLFIILRDRLRNLEKEVRQHALRVLADLIPVINANELDNHMEFLLPDLIINLSHAAPAVRKSAIDVFRIYLKNSTNPDEIVKEIMTVVSDDNHLKQGLLMAVPYFSNYQITEETFSFLIKQLYFGMKHDFLRETSICSLIKTRSKIGVDRFNRLLGDNLQDFQEICKENNIDLVEPNDDNVILETEITLETGPAITMKIHEEDELTSYAANISDRTDSINDDSESELVTRSPRKVHFGGEVVKMRTPESDSNQHSSDDNDIQTSLIIDRPTSIKITVSDNVAAIKTRHKSLIPVRISTGSGSTTPKKRIKSKRLHKSAPDLSRVQVSKIPLRHKIKNSSDNNESDKKEQIEVKSRVRKLSREDEFSPVPHHNEIEVFHNLTRSPERQQESEKSTYESFQLYIGDEKEKKYNEKETSLSPFEIILRDLTHKVSSVSATTLSQTTKEDTWSRSRALDDLIILLQKNSLTSETVSFSKLLQTLFLLEKQPRLQTRAQEALAFLVSNLKEQLIQVYDQLVSGVVKILPPTGVRLALLVMKQSSAKKFFESLKIEPNDREVALQTLIAAARTFPSSEIDLNRGVQIAFEAMKDNKRGVRQAALEALASLAQVAGNTMILQAINELSRENKDLDYLVTIVRTRLSRRQLPSVDLDGSIRYSSPREQEEFDWLCGGTPTLQKASSLNSIKVPSNNNYWRHNLRHELDLPAIRSPAFYDDSSNGNKEQLWAIDASAFPKTEGVPEKATLCPIYVLQRDTSQHNGKTYRNYDRGRSNSPPSRQRNDSETFVDVNGNKAKRFFRQAEQFRKSFSSEHIFTGNVRTLEPTSLSLSSRSSTTSTGSSTRSGNWMREFRSGIPIPINADTKIKFRSHRQSSETFTGPLIAQDPINRTKLESPQATPVIRRTSAQTFTPQQLPPPSSGSESSGYFTPPAEHPSKEQTPERFLPNQSFEENNNFTLLQEPNFQIVESETSETHELEPRQSSASSTGTTSKIEDVSFEEPDSPKKEESKSFSTLDEVDFTVPHNFSEPRSKSRSEGNIKTILPEITERKNINSAPPLNEIVPYSFEKSPEIDAIKISLPGSVASNDSTPTKKTDQSPKRLIRRSISVRTPSVKRINPKNDVKSVSRPKEMLSQGLSEMESGDWETIIKGLKSLIRLSRNYPEVLEPQMHAICVALSKNIKNLRSQVARTACQASSELFTTSKKSLEMELEELAAPLLQRTADTNKFLRSDANAALDAMSLHISVPRVVAVVSNKGSTHQNCVVRAAATRLLSDLAMRLGPEKIFQLPKETRDKFLFVGANGLTEGSLETRQHAKALMSTLVTHPQFHKALTEAVSQHTLRHIAKAINSLK